MAILKNKTEQKKIEGKIRLSSVQIQLFQMSKIEDNLISQSIEALRGDILQPKFLSP